MKSLTWVLVACIALAACGNPKDTVLPRELDKMDSIKSSLEKLTEEERGLVTGYIARHTVGAALSAAMGGLLGAKADPVGIPQGITLGKAIDEQRTFLVKIAEEEARQKALKDKLAAEREAALLKMRTAITVTLVSKALQVDRGYSGWLRDERLSVKFGYKNNTDKDISGVKGRVVVQDLFGDALSVFQISNDSTIKAGASTVWTGSRSLRFEGAEDRKFAELADEKFKVIWEPQVVVFQDGTKLTAPE